MKKTIALILVLLIALTLVVSLYAAAEVVAAPPDAQPPQEAVMAPADAPTVQTATEDAQETEPGGAAGFVTWGLLATYAGALSFVLIATQLTKGIGIIDRLPTQLWSWIVAMAGMYPAYYFTGQLTPEAAALIPINAGLVAFAANGGYEALSRVKTNFVQTV